MQPKAMQVLSIIGTTLIVTAWSGPAEARRTVIDGNSIPVNFCLAAAATPCDTATRLSASTFGAPGLIANFGFGPFDSVYVYDNGIISIGAAIAPGSDFSSLNSIGGNVLTAGYSSTRAKFIGANIQGPQLAFGNNGQNDFPSKLVVRITFCVDVNCSDDRNQQVNIFDLGSDEYALSFNYGKPFGTGDPIFPADAYAGYSFGGNGFQIGGAALQGLAVGLAPIQYRFPTAAAGVPEPATWAMMMSGFGAMGAALRRRKNVVRVRYA